MGSHLRGAGVLAAVVAALLAAAGSVLRQTARDAERPRRPRARRRTASAAPPATAGSSRSAGAAFPPRPAPKYPVQAVDASYAGRGACDQAKRAKPSMARGRVDVRSVPRHGRGGGRAVPDPGGDGGAQEKGVPLPVGMGRLAPEDCPVGEGANERPRELRARRDAGNTRGRGWTAQALYEVSRSERLRRSRGKQSRRVVWSDVRRRAGAGGVDPC